MYFFCCFGLNGREKDWEMGNIHDTKNIEFYFYASSRSHTTLDTRKSKFMSD